MALPIHFYTFLLQDISFSHNTHRFETPNRQNFRVWNSNGKRGHVVVINPDAEFSAVQFCSYTVLGMQYDRPSWQQLCFVFMIGLASVNVKKSYCWDLNIRPTARHLPWDHTLFPATRHTESKPAVILAVLAATPYTGGCKNWKAELI